MELTWNRFDENNLEGMDCTVNNDLYFWIVRYVNGAGYHWIIRRFDENDKVHVEASYDLPGMGDGFEFLSDAYLSLLSYAKDDISEREVEEMSQPSIIARLLKRAAHLGLTLVISVSALVGSAATPIYAYADNISGDIIVECTNDMVMVCEGQNVYDNAISSGGVEYLNADDDYTQYALQEINDGNAIEMPATLVKTDNEYQLIYEIQEVPNAVTIPSYAVKALLGEEMAEGDSQATTLYALSTDHNAFVTRHAKPSTHIQPTHYSGDSQERTWAESAPMLCLLGIVGMLVLTGITIVGFQIHGEQFR